MKTEFVTVNITLREYAERLVRGEVVRFDFEGAATFRTYLIECWPDLKFDSYIDNGKYSFKAL